MATALRAPRPFQAAGFAPQRSRAAAAPRLARLPVRALQDPWSTLGVPHNASEKEVKQAHRKLVKQHHPDVKSDDPLAHARFIRIQEAYELIMGKRSGKDIEGRPASQGGWDFHDWYWQFSMKRRSRTGKAGGPFAGAAGGAAADGGPGAAPRQQWQAQMAGLRQKAAAKRAQGWGRRPWQAPAAEAAAAGGASAAEPAAAASAAAAEPPPKEAARRESAWRSMTKNARKPTAAAAGAAAAAEQTLGGSAARVHAVGPASQPAEEQPRAAASAQPSPAQQAPEPRQQQHAAATADEPLLRHSSLDEPAGSHASFGSHSHAHFGSHSLADGHSSAQQHPVADAEEGSGGLGSWSHSQRLRDIMAQAAAMVQEVQRGAEGAAAAHHEALHAHAAAARRHLQGRLSLEQIASLLGRRSERGHGASHTPEGSASNAVPADGHLHRQFEATRRARAWAQGPEARQHHASAADGHVRSSHASAQHHHFQQHQFEEQFEERVGSHSHSHSHSFVGEEEQEEEAAEGEGEGTQQQHQQQQQDPYRRAAHARKFANREEVEGRLSGQLAGLKRRAKLKQEVQSTC